MRFFAVALIFSGVAASFAQTPQVPHKMRFADITLTIRDDARREIQKDVDALTKSPKYFDVKVERAKTYFPIIEKIFAEERLPTDFKYLVLQESALIADAVSVSNAVGFWQFKDFTAMEMGLRVDKHVDERMNIISSTRAAARYLKQNNYMFNNWVYALQSYQMGAGGVKREVGDENNGARHMEINSDTYWYVKKFLAHKVAFENAVKGEPQVKVQAIEVTNEKKVSDLARQLAIDEAELLLYNKWIRSGSIPDDKPYGLVIPYGKFNPEVAVAWTGGTPTARSPLSGDANDKKAEIKSARLHRIRINGLDAVKGNPGERASQMAARLDMKVSHFLKYNDISIDHIVREDVYYFTQKKKNKSAELNHTVAAGDDLWLISQHYGVSLRRLQKLNGISPASSLKPGDVVWLTARKPYEKAAQAANQPELEVQKATFKSDFFDWEVKPGAVNAVVDNPVTEEELVQVETVPANEPVMESNEGKNVNSPVTQPVLVVHEVKAADTLYSVARQYNVSIKEIMDWNGKADFTLSLGEKLKIFTR